MKTTTRTLTALALLFAAHQVFIHVIEPISVIRLLNRQLHWRYVHQAVFFFGVPILMLAIFRRRASDYALLWNRHVAVSIATILGLTLALPITVDFVVGQLTPVKASMGYLLSTLVFQTIFSGCGEELSFRGMYQGEVNRVAGRGFRIGSTRFGLGVFVGALFFGLGHVGISNVLHGGSPNFAWFAYAGLIGLFLGFVREFVGCVIIVGFLHASLDTYSHLVQPSIPGRVVHFIAVGVVCYLLFNRKIHAGERIPEQSAADDAEDRPAHALR